MSLPPLADLNALKVRIPGGVDSADENRAMAALEDASAEVRHAAERTWVDSNGDLDDPPDIAVRITLRVAKALFLNPHDYRSEQIGEYAYQMPSGGMLTEWERQQLTQLSGDLLSVEMQLPYEVYAPTADELDEIREDLSGWMHTARRTSNVDEP